MVAACSFEKSGDGFACSRCGRFIKAARLPIYRKCNAAGLHIQALPGTELHALLRDWLAIEPAPDCPCRSMAATMDRLGPDWCESLEGMARILNVMRAEHGRRRANGTTLLPWSDFGARQLVRLACRRARAKAAR